MKKFIFTLLLSVIPVLMFSQKLHTPAEILQIMEKSNVSYNINMLEAPIQCPDRSNLLNLNNVYRVSTDSSLQTLTYTIKPEARSYFEKAEEHFSKRNIDSARQYYEKVLEADSSYYKVMTYLGQVNGTLKNDDQAIMWYNKAIEKNYIDYMAHWFLGDIYRMQEKYDRALDEVIIASILNRNNPRIKKSLYEITDLARIKTADWCFVPQCEISKEQNGVKVSLNENWIGYAMAKALWKYEPGYRQSMGVEENQYSTLEDRECLISLMAGLLNSKKNLKNNPELSTLKEAMDKDYLNEYILYEIVLPDHPEVAYQLSESVILRIRDYVLKVRFK